MSCTRKTGMNGCMDSPGKVELFGSKALLLGYGAIGKLIEERLKAFNVDVTIVRRTPGPSSLAPDAWQCAAWANSTG